MLNKEEVLIIMHKFLKKLRMNKKLEFIKEMELPIVGEFLEFLKKIKLGKLN